MYIKHTSFLLLAFTLFLSGCKNPEVEVTVAKEGQGTVAGSKINCGETCEATHYSPWLQVQKKRFTTTTLNAQAEPGYSFYGWSGSVQSENTPTSKGCGTNEQCTLYLETECVGIDFRPSTACFEFLPGSIDLHAIFMPEGSVLSSDWDQDNSTCLISTTNELKCWGYYIGGDKAPSSLNNPTEVKVSRDSACVKDDNGLQCWGSDSVAAVPALTNLQAFDVSVGVACAISGSEILCWGSPTRLTHYQPIPTIENPVDIRLGVNGACVEDNTGNDTCWGSEIRGQINTPALSGVTDLALFRPSGIRGLGENCVIEDNGVACWGAEPTSISAINGLSNPTELAGITQRACLVDNAELRCWKLEDGVYTEETDIPNEFKNVTGIAMSKGSPSFTQVCGFVDGAAKCWHGGSEFVEPTKISNVIDFASDGPVDCFLGTDKYECATTTDTPTTRSFDIQNPTSIARYNDITCVGGSSGLQCWPGFWTALYESAQAPTNLTNVTDIAITRKNGCAVANNQVTCWGSNNLGVLDVPELSNPSKVIVGDSHACAIDDSGVVCWGERVPN